MGTSKHQTIVQAKGSRDSLAEVGEVFAWLGAAIRTNPGSVSVGYCQVKVVACPLGVSTDRTSRSFQMSFEIREPIIRDENGTCWTKLFRNPVIAIGFPILTRPQKETGLELSLPMMAGLSQAKYVVQFDNVPFVKGFSTMLIPTHYSSGSTTWHLLYNEDRKRISYQDCRVSACQNQALKHASMFEIERSRHIVGWSSSVKVYAGAKEGNYSIQRSGYTDRIPGLDLERLSLSVGNVATVGTSFAIGVKDVPLHLSREGTYVDKIRDIHASFFIFFDTDDRRGWMVNGATALLHIVRAHLEDLRNSLFYSEDDCFSPKDFQEASEPYLSDSAVQVLLSKHNRQLVISSDEVNHRTEITREERNLIKKVEKWDERQFRFQDLVEQKWHILEQILDSQCSRDSSGVKVKPPTRQYLRGFDFADVATPTQDLSLKVTTLKACGKAWIGFSQAIRAITLFGRGFGDVFVPTKTSNNLCSHWKEVPKGYDCLVACIEDLNKLTTQRGNPKAVPARLVEDLCWHKPNMLFEACECKNKKNKSRRRLFTRNESCLRIQEFVSADSNYQKINSPGSLVSFKHGAAIFGRSSHDVTGWKSKITEELEREDTTQIELKPESQPADSGLGSSVVSVDSLKTTSKSSKKKIAFATKTNVS
jgi:hypothetical protein